MILFDGIIYHLNSSGGIAAVFNELISRMPDESYSLLGFNKENYLNKRSKNFIYQKPRILERYRRAIIGNQYELFHSTYYRLPSNKSCKVVTTVHDYIYEIFSSGLKKKVHSNQKNRSLIESDRIICVSESTKKDLIEISGSSYEKKTTVIHNGVSEDYFFKPEVNIESQIIYIGKRAGYKNFKSLVIALSKFNDLRLVCVGGGQFSKREINFMNKYIKNRYDHRGFLTNHQLNIEYNKSLCLVYPSLYEGFGIPILEAMKAGCPVIAVNKSSIPEVAGDSAVLTEKGHPDEIIQSLHKIMLSNFREEIVAKGFIQSKKFGWNITFNKTLKVYEELIGRNLKI